jgi:hypothetical protein
MELRYLRDTDKREAGPAVRYFAERTAIPRFYQVHLGERHFETGKVTVLPFLRLCVALELPWSGESGAGRAAKKKGRPTGGPCWLLRA